MTDKDFEDDEEISIDFSKIKKFFKKAVSSDEQKKAQEPVKHSEKPAEAQDTPKHETQPVEENLQKAEEKQLAVEESQPQPAKEVPEQPKPEIKTGIPAETHDSDEEISFDFSKIKNFFKKSEKTDESDEDSADIGDVTEVVKKGYDYVTKSAWIIPTVLLIIALAFSVGIRYQSAILPITDDWAMNNIQNTIKSQVTNEVNSEYPNLPADRKNQIINERIQQVLKEHKSDIEKSKQQLSAEFKKKLQKDVKDSEGNIIGQQTYLLAIDPYYWMLQVKNILDHGHPGDELREGKPYDNHMFAPNGRYVPRDTLHAYISAYTYRFFSIFNKNLDLMVLMFYMPIILSALAVIPAFFITRRVGGNFGGFVAGFIVAIHPAFLTRTMGGFSDTDPYNVTFPLYITWLFLLAFKSDDLKFKSLFSALAGLLLGIYAKSWTGWWYIFYILVGTAGIYLVYHIVVNLLKTNSVKSLWTDKRYINTALMIIVLVLSTGIFVSLTTGTGSFKGVISNPYNFATLKDVGTKSVWPNVYTTVAEQNESTFSDVIKNMGGQFLMALAVLGIILAVTKKDKKDQYDIKYSIFLILWFATTIFASVKGVRFLLLLVPAFAIAFGLSLGIIQQYLTNFISRELKVNRILTAVVIGILLCLVLFIPWTGAKNQAKNDIPSMTDAWYESLEKIKMESQPDAIITSWWDFGHWFKMIADRPVTFDGTSQGTPMAHWVGKSLLTDDERTSVGILRMLDCGSNDAYNELNKVIQKQYKSIDILYEIIVMDKEEAKNTLLGYGLSQEQASAVLEKTHCEPPEAFFITSDDMIGKSGVWGHFGAWDFKKATIFNKVQNTGKQESISFMMTEFNYSQEQADNTYNNIQSLGVGREANDWIAPWPGISGGVSACSRQSEESIICPLTQGGTALINLTTMDVKIPTSQGDKRPDVLVYTNETQIIEKYFSKDNIGFGLVLIPTESGYSRIMATPSQATSIFTKLYFLDGHGLKYFEKFSDKKSAIGQRIVVWKVDWQGTQENIHPAYQIEEVEETAETDSTPEEMRDNESLAESVEENSSDINESELLDNILSNESDNASVA